jgi:hypothetical protein
MPLLIPTLPPPIHPSLLRPLQIPDPLPPFCLSRSWLASLRPISPRVPSLTLILNCPPDINRTASDHHPTRVQSLTRSARHSRQFYLRFNLLRGSGATLTV